MELENLLEEIAITNEEIAILESKRNSFLGSLSEMIGTTSSGDYVVGDFTVRVDSGYQTPAFRYKVLRNIPLPLKPLATDQTEYIDKPEPC